MITTNILQSPKRVATKVRKSQVWLAFDERMALHRPLDARRCCCPAPGSASGNDDDYDVAYHFDPATGKENQEDPNFVCERPARILACYDALQNLENALVSAERHSLGDGGMTSDDAKEETFSVRRRFLELTVKPAKRKTIELVHSPELYEWLRGTRDLSNEALQKLTDDMEDLYFCPETFLAARLAVGACVGCVNAVTNASTANPSTRAIAVVRPPGHHAGRDEAMGKSREPP